MIIDWEFSCNQLIDHSYLNYTHLCSSLKYTSKKYKCVKMILTFTAWSDIKFDLELNYVWIGTFFKFTKLGCSPQSTTQSTLFPSFALR